MKDTRWQVRFNQRNRGITPQFEEHVRCTLATVATARQVQDMLLLDANYMLSPEHAVEFVTLCLKYVGFSHSAKA
jgi:hypothetical protein